MNFKVPQPDDDFDYYGNSSQDESRGSQGSFFFFNSKLRAPLDSILVNAPFFHWFFIRLENFGG